MRILVITGAGVSAESGIPTFRGTNGYWRNLDPAKLATPQAFKKNPKLIWEWYNERRQRIRTAEPNPAHQAIVKLAAHADEFLLVTQNVDDLHLRAESEGQRLPRDKVVQIHGDIFVTRCSHCERREELCDAETASPVRRLPECPECGALMRPGVVWFGEQLDPGKIGLVEDFLTRGDCNPVIVAGTTAPFGYIIDWALRGRGQTGQLIEVNPEETSLSQFATKSFREPAGVALPRLVDELLSKVLA
jgi:NAD-dependent deacetylase